jgi:hypothetical protein
VPEVSAGIIGAVVLGPGRALGETITAAIVSGSVTGQHPAGIQDAGQPGAPHEATVLRLQGSGSGSVPCVSASRSTARARVYRSNIELRGLSWGYAAW